MIRSSSNLDLLRFTIYGFLALKISATCYFPDGTVSGADVACYPSASDSFCCFNSQACLSNGLCVTGYAGGQEQYARGTCTDPNWESGACSDFCLDDRGGSGNAVFSCNTTSDTYCCDEGCSCEAGSGSEIINFPGSPYTVTVIGVKSSYPNPSSTTSTPFATTTASSSTTSPTSSSSDTTPTSVSSSSSTPTNSSSDDKSSSSSSNGKSIGIGVGVGIAVGLIVIALGFFFLQRRWRNSRGIHFNSPATSYRDSTTTRSHGATELGTFDQNSKFSHPSELPI